MTRRDFVQKAAVGGAGGAFGLNSASGSPQDRSMFRTSICDLLGIDHPIIQAPMQSIATPQLVAAVAEAGGIGILAGIGLPLDVLRQQIREVKRLTNRPFGVNLILHSAIRPPVDPAKLNEEHVRSVQSVLNRFRVRLGIPSLSDPPPRVPDLIPAAFDLLLEEGVPLFSTGLGLPDADMVTRCRERKIRVMSMIATVPDALEAEKLGVDIIVAQGAEAGGHRSLGVKPVTPERAAIGGLALIPQVVRAVRVPVLAAGGITDGRGLVAAVALGASGVLVGTRFIATTESGAAPFHKQALVDGDSDQTTLSDAFTGHYARFLTNAYIEEFRASGTSPLPPVIQQMAARDIIEAAAKQRNASLFPLYAGQGVGMIDDIPSASAVVRSMVDEARATLEALPARVGVQIRTK